MDKLKMHSPDMTQENIKKILELFPNCKTEAHDDKGNVRLAINFDQLKQELTDSIVEGPQERYHLNWPGKREALVAANAPIAKTLRPCRKESLNFDMTENLFIEGDNLDALKLLQESYLGKVKMIYIDPPYNTGNDFIYNDDFSIDKQQYFYSSSEVDKIGNRLSVNTTSNGRFHSDWLSLMYPRLRLARNLLSDDGAIFINIDDTELSNLKKICDEIFGEDNFVGNVAWKHTQQSKNDERYFARVYNSLLVYRKSESLQKFRLPRTERDNKNYSNPDSDPKGAWRPGDVRSPSYRQTLCFDIETPSGKKISPPENGWRWSKDVILEKINTGEIFFSEDESKIIRKIYLYKQEGRTPESVWEGDLAGTSRYANSELKELFEGSVPFDTPKPTKLIKRIANLFFDDKDFVVLDFFAGSSTTADAIMQLNSEDGGNRKFVMIQLAEPCAVKSDGFKQGYKYISDISKERIRRAGARIIDSEYHSKWNKDVGFRVLKVDTSNMSDVFYSPNQTSQSDLDLLVDHIKPDRTDEDLLFQVLLDAAVELTLPITLRKVGGKPVYFVDDNALVACFGQGISEDLVKELASFQPLQVVFRDDAFESNSMKINAEQIFKQLSPNTVVKAI